MWSSRHFRVDAELAALAWFYVTGNAFKLLFVRSRLPIPDLLTITDIILSKFDIIYKSHFKYRIASENVAQYSDSFAVWICDLSAFVWYEDFQS